MNDNIAILVRELDNPRGAEKSMFELAARLSTNHNIQVFGIGGISREDAIGKSFFSKRRSIIPTAVGRLARFIESPIRLSRCVRQFDPDIVISQHEVSIVGHQLKKRTGCEHFVFVHDYEMVSADIDRHPIGQFSEEFLWPLTKPIIERIIYTADSVIANSKFVGNVYAEYWDNEFQIVYPIIDVRKYVIERTGEKILHVTPTKNKGIDITLEIAERRPDLEFLVVGETDQKHIRAKLEQLENVEYRGYVEDIRTAYNDTKIAIVPSQWNEPFGRIPVEVGINGIPSVCSNLGGLPESVGDNRFTVQPDQPDQYINKIDEIRSNYEIYSEISIRNSYQKRSDTQIEKLNEIIFE